MLSIKRGKLWICMTKTMHGSGLRGALWLGGALSLSLVVGACHGGSTELSETLPSSLAHAHGPVVADCEREKVRHNKDVLANAEERKSRQLEALTRIRSDPRWEDPGQVESLEYASATTSSEAMRQDVIASDARDLLAEAGCLGGSEGH